MHQHSLKPKMSPIPVSKSFSWLVAPALTICSWALRCRQNSARIPLALFGLLLIISAFFLRLQMQTRIVFLIQVSLSLRSTGLLTRDDDRGCVDINQNHRVIYGVRLKGDAR